MQGNPHSGACQISAAFPPQKPSDLREAFSGQARLLAGRAERDLRLDITSLERLFALGELIDLERMAA
jgi:hypothetical protein